MYIECEITTNMDFIELIVNELFHHATSDESADFMLELTKQYFEFYRKELGNGNT